MTKLPRDPSQRARQIIGIATGWEADTCFGQIGKNTELAIREHAWVDGGPAVLFPVAAKITGAFPDGSVFSFDVIETDGALAVIEYGGVQWGMIRVSSADEFKCPCPVPKGAPATYWVILRHVDVAPVKP